MVDQAPRPRWRFYRSAGGTPEAKNELDALPAYAQAGLADLMHRYKMDEGVLPREVDNYGGGIYALKFSSSHNEFRCYFAHESTKGPTKVYLALAFMYKKTEAASLGSAKDRLKDWRARSRAKKRLAKRQKTAGK